MNGRGAARETPAGADPHDCRCVCGSLVARVVPEGVELKCRRCKRTLVVPLQEGAAAPAPVRARAARLP